MNEAQTPWASIANRSIRKAVDALSPAEREHFEESAGILEHCGEMERADAEGIALQQISVIYRQYATGTP